MVQNITELQTQIIQKNWILNTLCTNHGSDKDKIESTKVELDALLYQFYKAFKRCIKN